jgi:hypothetical protein
MSRSTSFLYTLGCFVVGLLAASGSSVTAQVDQTNSDVPIQVRLTPDKKTVLLGEPLFVSFEVTNLSGENLCLSVGGDYRNKFGRPERFTVSVSTEDGKELPQFTLIGLGGLSGCDAIESGATYTVRLFLPHWATIERTGSYRVNVKRAMDFSTYEGSGPRKSKYSMEADISAEFTVVAADENELGAVINSLGSVMLDISDPRAVDSATALAWIQDKRVISYFAEALRKFGDYDFETTLTYYNEYLISLRSITALAEYDDDRAIDALRGMMTSPNETVRLRVAAAFGDSPHKAGIKLLLKMQDDSNYSVRLQVAQRLKNVKTRESLAALQKLLKDENEQVRKAAKESLK